MKYMESLTISDNDGLKRLKAVYKFKDGKTKTITFGMKGSAGTFADGSSEQKKDAYIARHRVNEDWSDKFSAGFLSRFVLWSERSNEKIKKVLQDKTGIKNISVNFNRIKM
jgi:hypothetical protein